MPELTISGDYGDYIDDEIISHNSLVLDDGGGYDEMYDWETNELSSTVNANNVYEVNDMPPWIRLHQSEKEDGVDPEQEAYYRI